jgi:hypothetical protein
MRLPFRLPWALPAEQGAVSDVKAAGGGVSLVAAEGEARWTGRSYASLSREGFMKNPVAHRTVRLVAEAAAAIPWLAYRDAQELDRHPALALLATPNARMGGADFFEALYGHLLLSGNAYVEPLAIGPRPAELHLLRPDRVSVVAGADGWPEAYDYRAGSQRRRIPAGGSAGGAGRGLLTTISVFRRWRPPRWRSTCTMPRRAGTRRCSTIRQGPRARWSTSRRRAAISRPTSMSG